MTSTTLANAEHTAQPCAETLGTRGPPHPEAATYHLHAQPCATLGTRGPPHPEAATYHLHLPIGTHPEGKIIRKAYDESKFGETITRYQDHSDAVKG